jgi:hypothetical protein
MKAFSLIFIVLSIVLMSCRSLPKPQNEGMQVLNYYFLNYYTFLSDNMKSNHIRITSNRKTTDGTVFSQDMFFDNKNRISRIDWYVNSIKRDSTLYSYKEYLIEKITSGESALKASYNLKNEDMIEFTMSDKTGFDIYGYYKRISANSIQMIMIDKKTNKERMKTDYIFDNKKLVKIREFNVYATDELISEHFFFFINNRIDRIDNKNRGNKNDTIQFFYNDTGNITKIAYSLNNETVQFEESIQYL